MWNNGKKGEIRMSDGKVIVLIAFVIVLMVSLVVGFWGTVGYVLWHFISKYW